MRICKKCGTSRDIEEFTHACVVGEDTCEFVAYRKLSVEEICRIFAVPPEMLA